MTEHEPIWPPPLANRETRRHCEHKAKGNDEDGYFCVSCGMKTERARAR